METTEETKEILFTNRSHKINIKFEFPEEGINEPKVISISENDLLETACDKLFYQSKKIKLTSKHYFYLKKNNEKVKELENKKICELCLNEEDIILISYKKLLIPLTNLPIFDSNKNSNILQNNNIDSDIKKINKRKRNIKNKSNVTITETAYKKHKRNISNNPKETIRFSKEAFQSEKSIKKIETTTKKLNEKLFMKILLLIIVLLIIGGIIFVIIMLFKHKKKKEPTDLIFEKDKMVINKKYPTNLFMRFTSNKQTSITSEGNGIDSENSTNHIIQTSDFIFIVRENHTEIDITKK